MSSVSYVEVDDEDSRRAPTGETPFIIVELEPDSTDDGFKFDVRVGGGLHDPYNMAALLLMVVGGLTGVSPSAYAREIDLTRRLAEVTDDPDA